MAGAGHVPCVGREGVKSISMFHCPACDALNMKARAGGVFECVQCGQKFELPEGAEFVLWIVAQAEVRVYQGDSLQTVLPLEVV